MNTRNLLRITCSVMRQREPIKISGIIPLSRISCNCNNYAVNNLANITQKRNLFQDASKHEVTEGRERIYYGVLTPQIRAVKWFSLTTSAATILAQPFLINTVYANANIALVVGACSFIGFFTFGTPILLHFITKKYITHLDYDPNRKTYIASTVNFFCMLRETEFTPEDVKIPDVPGMFTAFIAKDKAMFLEPRFFQDPSHYAKIMGYDKPMDFKLFSEKEKE